MTPILCKCMHLLDNHQCTHPDSRPGYPTPSELFPDSNFEARLVDVVPIAFLNDTHPAIQSGPSHDGRLQLTAVPPEIRTKIYPYLLTKTQYLDTESKAVLVRVMTQETNSSWCDVEECSRGRASGKRTLPSEPKHWGAVGPRGVINILLVCRQLYHEAVIVLYGINTFAIDDVLRYRRCFIEHPTRGIGNVNFRSVKRVACHLPAATIAKTVWYESGDLAVNTNADLKSKIEDWTDVLCRDLPGLESLACRYPTEFRKVVWYDWARGANRRCMLWAVAHITKKHPKLRKVVWRAWGDMCGRVRPFDSDIRDWFEVHLTIASESKKVAVGKVLNIDHSYSPSKDIILDCGKIRRTSWEDLLCRFDWTYELPDSATSSEWAPGEGMDTPTVQSQSLLRQWRVTRDAQSTVQSQCLESQWRVTQDARWTEVATVPTFWYSKYLGPKPKLKLIEVDVNSSGIEAVDLLERKDSEDHDAWSDSDSE